MNFSIFFQEKTQENSYFLHIKALFLNETSFFPEISSFFTINLKFLDKIFDSLKNSLKNALKTPLFPLEKADFLKELMKKKLNEKKNWDFSNENPKIFKEILTFHHFSLIFLKNFDDKFEPPLMKYLLFIENSMNYIENPDIFELYNDFLLIVLKIADFSKENPFFEEKSDEILELLWQKRDLMKKPYKIPEKSPFYVKKTKNPLKFFIVFFEKLLKNPVFSEENTEKNNDKTVFFLMNFFEIFFAFTKGISSVKSLKTSRKILRIFRIIWKRKVLISKFTEEIPVFDHIFQQISQEIDTKENKPFLFENIVAKKPIL